MEENQILFKNTFKPTEKHYQLVFRQRIFGSTNLQAILLFAACGVLMLLVLVPRILAHEPLVDSRNSTMFIVVIVLFLMTLALYFLLPIFSAKGVVKSRKEKGLELMTFDNSFLEDRLMIHVTPDDRDTEVSYQDFGRISRMADMIILSNRRGQVVMLDRNGFSKGTEAELMDFLKKKCPQAKIR